ncbi:formate/nitrite transporter family protein [Cytobacillus sp. Hz8]|uniref:formate/nitrite transporter family protein n=1 Tax=Cytobacillus sp. Hz8 TaxID=3347168 RepID=UPI0035DE9876
MSSFYKPEQIVDVTIKNGIKKTSYPALTTMILGFEAGAFIALGYLLYIRITAPLTGVAAGFTNLLGGAVFPIGLILTLIAGGELLTGNMMVVALSRMAKRVRTSQLLKNWLLVTISNFIGAIFVAYFFGHVIGLTETGPFLAKTVDLAEHKLGDSFIQAFFSGIGCNWLVAAAVWLSYGSEDMMGKIAGIWFPTMAFVSIGFQHIVANMFVIPAAILAGYFTWLDYLGNFVPVYLGNAVGGALFIAMAYWLAYKKKEHTVLDSSKSSKQAEPMVNRGGM